VDQPRDQALQELPLAEDDHRLVAGPARDPVKALGGLPEQDEIGQELGAASEQEPADGERRRERRRSDRDVYWPRAFLSSALIAGTISVRSPITA
jgi:hypothetical protein